jgi:hypothetical protein
VDGDGVIKLINGLAAAHGVRLEGRPHAAPQQLVAPVDAAQRPRQVPVIDAVEALGPATAPTRAQSAVCPGRVVLSCCMARGCSRDHTTTPPLPCQPLLEVPAPAPGSPRPPHSSPVQPPPPPPHTSLPPSPHLFQGCIADGQLKGVAHGHRRLQGRARPRLRQVIDQDVGAQRPPSSKQGAPRVAGGHMAHHRPGGGSVCVWGGGGWVGGVWGGEGRE